MMFEFQLEAPETDTGIDASYLYEMGAAIMHGLTLHNEKLAKELHDGKFAGKLKMFSFSPLNSDPHPHYANGRIFFGKRCYFRIAGIIPEVVTEIVGALLESRELQILGKRFLIRNVDVVSPPFFKETLVWRPFGQAASIVTAWTKGKDRKVFVYPDTCLEGVPSCAEILIGNLRKKMSVLKELRPDIYQMWNGPENPDDAKISIDFLPLKEGVKYARKRYLIKNSPVCSWRCPMRVTAPEIVQRIIFNVGCGQHHAQGFGMCREGLEEK